MPKQVTTKGCKTPKSDLGLAKQFLHLEHNPFRYASCLMPHCEHPSIQQQKIKTKLRKVEPVNSCQSTCRVQQERDETDGLVKSISERWVILHSLLPLRPKTQLEPCALLKGKGENELNPNDMEVELSMTTLGLVSL